jgi:hypothetical protein
MRLQQADDVNHHERSCVLSFVCLCFSLLVIRVVMNDLIPEISASANAHCLVQMEAFRLTAYHGLR